MSIKSFLEDIEHIPTISSIALKVLQRLANIEVNINELTHLIEQDQALTANILKVANSGYFEFMDEVKTIKKAVVLIGFKMTREITSAFAVKSLFESLKPVHNFDYTILWKHALLTAIFAQKLAARNNLPEDEIYMSALLHDIGIVVQLFYDSNFYAELYNQAIEKKMTYYQLEIKQNTELTHPEVGYQILHKWNLPVSIIIPVRWHHQLYELDKNLIDYREQIMLITMANVFSHLYVLDEADRDEYLASNPDTLMLKDQLPEFDQLFMEVSELVKQEESYLDLFL